MAVSTLDYDRKQTIEFIMNYDDAVAARNYINDLQAGSATGTLIGIGGFVAGPVGTLLGASGLLLSILESYSGSTLETQEDLYTWISEQLGGPIYDLVKCEQQMDYVIHRKDGVEFDLGWVTKGIPVIIGMHTDGGWVV